jgi:hypothetical protein
VAILSRSLQFCPQFVNALLPDDSCSLVFIFNSPRMAASDARHSSVVYHIHGRWRVAKPISLPTLWTALLLASAVEGFHAETKEMA